MTTTPRGWKNGASEGSVRFSGRRSGSILLSAYPARAPVRIGLRPDSQTSGASAPAVSNHAGVYPIWLSACSTYHPDQVASALRPAVQGVLGRATGTVCVLVDAPFADPRMASLASVDPRIVQGLVATLPSGPVTIAARSLPGFPTRYTLQRAGYAALSRSGAHLQPLEETDHYAVTVPSSGATLHVPVPYTALFSNSARAHRRGKTRDWVVIYHDGGDRQYTVITATRGPLKGRRIVVGRFAECERLYESAGHPAQDLAVARPA